MLMTNPIYFDQICPNLPIADPANKAVRDDFAATFTQKWPENTLLQSGYGADDLAAMLVTSQYLQRLALRHGEDVGPCLNAKRQARSILQKPILSRQCNRLATKKPLYGQSASGGKEPR